MRPTNLLAIGLLALLSGCTTTTNPTVPSSTTTTEIPTTSSSTPASIVTTIPTTTTTTISVPSTIDPSQPVVLPEATSEMPPTWVERFHIPYGDSIDALGTYLGGDGEGLQIGPEYGAQVADGTWWFIDTAKYRLAHFSESGQYLGQIEIPEHLLVNGTYFQFSMPRSLADGSFLAAHLTSGHAAFLRVVGEQLESFTVPFEVLPRADDGSLIYGFTFDEVPQIMAVDPLNQTATPVDSFKTRTGENFTLAGGAGPLVVELGEHRVELEFEADTIGGPAYIMAEVASDQSGRLHLFLLGFPELDESFQLAGYLTISAEGAVSTVEPILNPFTPSDPGTPSRLGVRPGTDSPWFMVIGEDGVTVYGRS